MEITCFFSFEFSYYFWQFQPCIERALFTPSYPSVFRLYPHLHTGFFLFPIWFIFYFLLRSLGLLSLVSMDIASPTRPQSWWLLPQHPSTVPSSPKSPSPSKMARKSLHDFFYSGPSQATTDALSSGLKWPCLICKIVFYSFPHHLFLNNLASLFPTMFPNFRGLNLGSPVEFSTELSFILSNLGSHTFLN